MKGGYVVQPGKPIQNELSTPIDARGNVVYTGGFSNVGPVSAEK